MRPGLLRRTARPSRPRCRRPRRARPVPRRGRGRGPRRRGRTGRCVARLTGEQDRRDAGLTRAEVHSDELAHSQSSPAERAARRRRAAL
ncbi:MAG: hypothetical protein EBU23_17000 [Mycobacteriaceae bacterium]|nr:hypothetical protein [Mycobacteriaceae bacterium]